MIFFGYRSKCVRLTGRWYKEENTAISTACGSKIEFIQKNVTVQKTFTVTEKLQLEILLVFLEKIVIYPHIGKLCPAFHIDRIFV